MQLIIDNTKEVKPQSRSKTIFRYNREEFYEFCNEWGYNYWLIDTAMSLGIAPGKEVLDNFAYWATEKSIARLERVRMTLRAKERFKNNPYYQA